MRTPLIGIHTRVTHCGLIRRVAPIALVAALVPVLLACGNDDSEPTTKAGAPGADGPVVRMTDQLKFAPDKLTVKVGQTVTWRNVGSVAHTVTGDPAKAAKQDNARLPSGAEPWDSGIIEGRQSYSRAFETPGEYTYFCIPHEAAGMVATLTVTS